MHTYYIKAKLAHMISQLHPVTSSLVLISVPSAAVPLRYHHKKKQGAQTAYPAPKPQNPANNGLDFPPITIEILLVMVVVVVMMLLLVGMVLVLIAPSGTIVLNGHDSIPIDSEATVHFLCVQAASTIAAVLIMVIVEAGATWGPY